LPAVSTRHVAVGPLEIEYDDVGRGDRAFVLVHGFTGSRDDWADVLDELAPLGRTLAPDQRGHGGTTNPGVADGYTFEQLVADLAGFLDAVGAPRVDLLGHSLGGMVAQRFALEHPERLASLVLMDTAPGPLQVLPPGALEAAARIARESGTGALVPVMRQMAATDEKRPAATRRCEEAMGPERFWERIQRKMDAMDPEAFACLAALLGDHPATLPRLAEIACPTLVMVGAEDAPFLAASRALAAGIPRARLEVIRDAAHSPQLENRDAWLDAIRRHLGAARDAS
jgi:pimeloyl-ACP methyl ester carboxylesterase